jgi:drug/metabolite transporter (DMT)-like permease
MDSDGGVAEPTGECPYRWHSKGDAMDVAEARRVAGQAGNSRERLTGVALVVLSAVAWSLNGLYTRYLATDVYTTLAGRGLAITLLLTIALVAVRGRESGRLIVYNARRAAIVIVSGSLCMITFIAALFHTTVANVTVIYAISPLIAAVLARFLIGDRLVARTLVAFAVALAGIFIMVGASFGTSRLLGDFLALLMSATFAIVIVEMRRKPDIDNLTSSLLTSFLTFAALLPFASFGSVTLRDAVLLFLFGFTSNVLGFFLFIAGVRRMPPAEAGLIATIEIVLAPLWVWLIFSEGPGSATVLGGAVVLAAVLFQISGELKPGRSRGIVIAEGLAIETGETVEKRRQLV